MIPVMYRPSLIGAATLVPSMDLFANLLPVDIFFYFMLIFKSSKKVFVFFNRQSAAQFPVRTGLNNQLTKFSASSLQITRI